MKIHTSSLILYVFYTLLLQALLCSTKLAAQCMTYPIKIEEKEKNASTIVLGKLKDQHSYWDEKQSSIYTLNIIEVTAYFKGNSGAKEIGVITRGGQVGTQVLEVFPSFQIYPYNKYIFFLKNDNKTIDYKNLRKKHPKLIQAETYAYAQGAITKQFGMYSELHNPIKYTEEVQFKRITKLTKQAVTTPTGKAFLPRTKPIEERQKTNGLKSLDENPLFSLLSINDITPNPTNGGTIDPNNYITVTGSGFNNDIVFYANADDAGHTMVKTEFSSDILSWSHTFVQEKVHQFAGTGPVQISGMTSTTPLQINWSHICAYPYIHEYGKQIRQKVFFADTNNQGGYTFTYSTQFKNHEAAKAAFERAFVSWRCATHINWKLNKNSVNISSAAYDDMNTVGFNSNMPQGILGWAYFFHSSDKTEVCNKENEVWWLKETDIEFNDSFVWNFDPTPPTDPSSAFDFETVCLHELGHAHGLRHVIDIDNDFMHPHYNGIRTLSNNNIAAGNAKLAYSVDEEAYCFFPDAIHGEMILLDDTYCTLDCLPLTVEVTGTSTLCKGETVGLDAGTYGFGDTYLWSNGASTQTIAVETEGTYTVEVTSFNNCTGLGTFTVVSNNSSPPNITGKLSFCKGKNASINAGASYSSYMWSTGETSYAISVNTPGVYTISVTDNNNCIGTAEAAVTEMALPQPQITGEHGFCPNETVELSVENDFQTYLWSTGQTTPNIQVNNAGTYIVIVTDDNSCTNTSTHLVNAYDAPVPQIEANTIFCNENTISLSTDSNFIEYLWSNGSEAFYTDASSIGTYTVTVANNNRCIGIGEITIEEQTIPAPEITGTLQICDGASTSLTVMTGFKNYLWSNGGSSNSISVSTPGTYTVTVSDINNCTNTNEVTVQVFEQLTPIIEGKTSICEGEAITLNLNQSYTFYLWSNNATTPNINISPTETSTYSVVVIDENQCSSNASVDIVVHDLPEVNIAGSLSFCEGSHTTLFVEEDFIDYLWNTGETSKSIIADTEGIYNVEVTDQNGCKNTQEVEVKESTNLSPIITGNLEFCEGDFTFLDVGSDYFSQVWSTGENSPTINVAENGVYAVTVTDENGCTGQNSINVNTIEASVPTIQGELQFCVGESTFLEVVEGFNAYAWNTGEMSQTIEVTEAGFYEVEIVDENGCRAKNSVNVNAIEASIPTIQGELQFCVGESTFLEVAEDFDTYIWSTGETTHTIEITEVGIYEVEVGDENGCTGQNSVNVNAIEASIPTIQGELQFCVGESASLEVEEDFDTYAWNTGETTQTIEVTEAGFYEIEVGDENGCTGQNSVNVNTIEASIPTIQGELQFCVGESASLEVEEDFDTYAWNTGETTQTITLTEAGFYEVEIVDENGCIGSEEVEVVMYPNFEVHITGDLEITETESSLLDAGTYSDNDHYLWTTGATTQTLLVSSPDIYGVTVTNSNGCSANTVVRVDLINTTENHSVFKEFQVLPNPFKETLRLTYTGSQLSSIQFNIYNTIGQIVESIYIEELYEQDYYEFDFSHFSMGTYYFQIQSKEWNQSGRLIKLE